MNSSASSVDVEDAFGIVIAVDLLLLLIILPLTFTDLRLHHLRLLPLLPPTSH